MLCVYSMHMARVNVYLPDPLAGAAREAGINVSQITQEALAGALAARGTDQWLDDIGNLDATGASHDDVMQALQAAREEFGDDGRG